MSEQDNSEFQSEWIWVRAGEHTQGNRVAIYEEDFRHPEGEAFIYGDTVAQVYPTEEVVQRMREGFLKEERNYQPPKKVAQARSEENESESSSENAPGSFTGATESNMTQDGQTVNMSNSSAERSEPAETESQRKAREKREAKDNS